MKPFLKGKAGRKPIKDSEKKKAIGSTFSPHIIKSLCKDVENGKARTINQMVTKIVNKYYKKIKEREKNKAKEENITDKKAA
jgi:hypothetical protein